MEFDEPISIDVECFECCFYIFIGQHFLVVYCGSIKFMEIYLAISVKIDFFDDVAPVVA